MEKAVPRHVLKTMIDSSADALVDGPAADDPEV